MVCGCSRSKASRAVCPSQICPCFTAAIKKPYLFYIGTFNSTDACLVWPDLKKTHLCRLNERYTQLVEYDAIKNCSDKYSILWVKLPSSEALFCFLLGFMPPCGNPGACFASSFSMPLYASLVLLITRVGFYLKTPLSKKVATYLGNHTHYSNSHFVQKLEWLWLKSR